MKTTIIPICTAILVFHAACAGASEKTSNDSRSLTFEKDIRPILKAYCFECHGEGKRLRGSLDLRLARLAATGGNSGAGLVRGHAAKSLIVKRIAKKEMPPGKVKLDAENIALIKRWIDEGGKTARPEPENIAKGIYITPEEKNFWAFQPIQRPSLPAVKNTALVSNPVDLFLLRKLEQKKLTFSSGTDKTSLMRRAYFDLIGLPPTPDEVRAFVSDTSPHAYEKLIDHLLASPHYGERWGRHWLDVAGYADSEGYSNDDVIRPYAYKYRDYVIRSFNADKPFDEFIREQLAGDEMASPPYDKLKKADLDKLIATGFLRMAPDGTGSRGVEQPVARNQVVADTIQIVSSALLGITVHCAQCHNHKYDPIPQEDYYRLRAVFEPAYDWKNWRTPVARRVALFSDADRKKAAAIEKEAVEIDKVRLKKQTEIVQRLFERELAKVPEDLRDAVRSAKETAPAKQTKEQKALLRRFPRVNIRVGQIRLYDRKADQELKKYSAKANKIRAGKPKPDFIRALTESPGKIPVTYLFERGEHEAPRQAVTPAGLSILQPLNLGSLPVNDKSMPTSGRRLAFANYLTSGKHPLVARVIVNRVWQHHFGRGIVASSGDFGFLGDRPTHPELLDWLADDFVRDGWKLKRLHKLLMTSTAYKQSSRRTPELHKIDPDNYLLGRMPLRRLDAETLRDSILHITGKLNKKPFGPPVPVTANEVGSVVIGVDTRDGAGRFTRKIAGLDGEEFRRSVYVQARRSQILGALDTFDSPTMNPNCHVRNASTVSPQALWLMNSRFSQDFSEHLAGRIRNEAGDQIDDQIKRAWQLVYSEEPEDQAVRNAAEFIRAQTNTFRSQKMNAATAQSKALANFCQALLSSNRFLHVD